MTSNSGQYIYEPLNNNSYSYQVSDSGYYLQNPYLSNSIPMTTNMTSPFPNNINVSIDITAKDRLESMYVYVIATFGASSVFFTSLIFVFSYLWYAIVQDYENLKMITISSIIILVLGLALSLILFVISHKKCKSLYRLVLDQGVFLHN